MLENNYVCGKCRSLTVSCGKCRTTKSMSWHTNKSGSVICLYCYDEEEEEDNNEEAFIIIDDDPEEEEEIETAAHLFFDMVVTLNNKCTVY